MKILMASLLVLLLYANICQANISNDEYELNKNCGDEAARYFSELHGNGEQITDTGIITASYFTHYNKTNNACYIQRFIVTYSDKGIPNRIVKILEEVRQNKLLGYCLTNYGDATAYSCIVGDERCSAANEFDKLIKHYMAK